MKYTKHIIVPFLVLLLYIPVWSENPGFKHLGFYLHEGWFFNYPFAVRTWNRDDFSKMFNLLRMMGYDRVGIWPMLEAIPMPLSNVDEMDLREFRHTIDDAHATSLECWLIQCPNLTPDASVAAKPWKQRNPYHAWQQVRLDDPVQAEPYLAHRTAMISILNNADAYVTIDGDPGGYPGAKPEEWLNVFLADRAALDRYGIDPTRQRLIPWIWCGWGTKSVWGGNPESTPLLIKPYCKATMELFKTAMPEPWELLPGRSNSVTWANGRVNIDLADSLDLINRSTIFCYEAIEFEPTPPASVLQFDHIRRILREESKYASSAEGVFGNAQQPIMALPNIYFFARGAKDLAYLDKTDEEVLRDFADFIGGPANLLIPAWDCLNRTLEMFPSDLAEQLRNCKLTGAPSTFIPGGAEQYLEILAQQVESRIILLQATVNSAITDEQAAKNIAKGITALVNWWKVHHYVLDGNPDEPFDLRFVPNSQVSVLHNWCLRNVKNQKLVSKQGIRILLQKRILTESQALNVLSGLFSE